MDEERRRNIALFRYTVIASLLVVPPERGARKREIERLSRRLWEHPTRGPIRIGFGTIEEWLYLYRRDGLDALLPAPRKDRQKSRRIDDGLAEKIEALLRARPELDGPGILAELRVEVEEEKLPSLSALYRFLRARGLHTRGRSPRQDHRAYAFELAGDCWQCDVMYGPTIPNREGKRQKTFLIAIIDDATRLIVHGQFYFEQHLSSLKDCMKQGFKKRGLPRRFYVDQGKIFRSRMILQLSARLGIILIHSRPYRPQGRAKIERFFGTVRRCFLRRLDLERIESLEHLDRLFFAWVEGEYHQKPHRGLDGETPLDRWVRLSEGVRPLPRDVDLDELFLEETTRRVTKDGTLTLKGRAFEVGPHLIGTRVKVLFDPFDLRRVIVESGDGKQRREEAFPVDLDGNRRVRRNPPPVTPPAENRPELKALEDLSRRWIEENRPSEENQGEESDE